MRTLLIGARGQLGTALRRVLPGEVICPGRELLNLEDPAVIRVVLAESRPDVVINAAAYNLVDKAEEEPGAAFALNAFAVRELAHATSKIGARLVHISTDYVFGLGIVRTIPWKEADAPGPTSVYGASKLTGEHFAQAYSPQHFVIRTCGLYGIAESEGKGNFINTMLRLGRERGAVSVVDDQMCTPTFVVDLADAIVKLIATDRFGLYHATNSGATTWCRLAAEVFRLAKLDVKLTPITTAQFNAKANRPAFSVLDCSKLASVIGGGLSPWEDAVARYLAIRGELAGG